MQQIYRRTTCNFIEITLRHGYSVNLLHIFRPTFPKNTSGVLLLKWYPLKLRKGSQELQGRIVEIALVY